MGVATTEEEIEVIEGEGDIMLGRAMDIKVKVVIIMEVIEKIITTKGAAIKVVMQHIDISMTIGAKMEENIMETKNVIVGYKGRAGKENTDAHEISNIKNVLYSILNINNWICDVFLLTSLPLYNYFVQLIPCLVRVEIRGARLILHVTYRFDT